MIKIANLIDYTKYAYRLPDTVREDIGKRIGDWLDSGGSLHDDYVLQQYRYAEGVLNDVTQDLPTFVAYGNDELEAKGHVGEYAACPKCGKQCDVRYGEKVNADGKKTQSTDLAFVKCGCGTYLVGVKGKLVR